MTSMPLPNFVGIGAQRAATTWVHNCLRDHPDVYLPERKELHFFDTQYKRGVPWYEQHFKGHRGQKAVGEITPDYLGVPYAIPRLAALLPEARLFVVLREPVQRAYSAYTLLHERHEGMSFREACASTSVLIKYGLYATHLERVYEHFPRDRVKVVLYDDVRERPAAVLRELLEFLGVDPGFRPPAAGTIYNRILFPKAQARMRRAGMGWCLELVKHSPLGDRVKRWGKRDASDRASAIDPDHLRQLKATFRDDTLRLQEIIGRDLSAWL